MLEFVVSEYLHERFPELKEGQPTMLRAALVRREALARLARQWRLGSICSWGAARMRAGALCPATLCATFEAVIGALYLDQGLEVVRATPPIIAQQLELVQRDAPRNGRCKKPPAGVVAECVWCVPRRLAQRILKRPCSRYELRHRGDYLGRALRCGLRTKQATGVNTGCGTGIGQSGFERAGG